jgi:hypothetical protein
MQKYHNAVLDPSGNALAGVEITVRTLGDTLATLYSDNGITVTTNPVLSAADGEYSFYCANGRYNLTFTGTGITTSTETDVIIFDPDDAAALTFTPGPAPLTPVVGSVYYDSATNTLQYYDGTTFRTISVTNKVNIYTGNQSVTPVALTDAATIAVDAALSNNFYVTLGGNRTIGNPTNLTDGMIINLVIKQDGTGSRTGTFASKWDFGLAGAPTLSTGASKIDFVSAYYDLASDKLLATFRKDD